MKTAIEVDVYTILIYQDTSMFRQFRGDTRHVRSSFAGHREQMESRWLILLIEYKQRLLNANLWTQTLE